MINHCVVCAFFCQYFSFGRISRQVTDLAFCEFCVNELNLLGDNCAVHGNARKLNYRFTRTVSHLIYWLHLHIWANGLHGDTKTKRQRENVLEKRVAHNYPNHCLIELNSLMKAFAVVDVAFYVYAIMWMCWSFDWICQLYVMFIAYLSCGNLTEIHWTQSQ